MPWRVQRLQVLPHQRTEPVVQVVQVANERTEAESVVSCLQAQHHTVNWRDMAVLYRTNAQSRLFEEQMVSAMSVTPHDCCITSSQFAWALQPEYPYQSPLH